MNLTFLKFPINIITVDSNDDTETLCQVPGPLFNCSQIRLRRELETSLYRVVEPIVVYCNCNSCNNNTGETVLSLLSKESINDITVLDFSLVNPSTLYIGLLSVF